MTFRNNRWHHPSVIRLIEEGRTLHEYNYSPEEIIRVKARKLVQYAINLGWSGPPFDPHILASIIGIRVVPVDMKSSIDAMIVPSEDGRFNILLNRTVPHHERQNFSICHEISHTLFPDCAEFIRMRAKKPDKTDTDREVEVLCNIAASELLLPGDYFLESLRGQDFSLRSVQPLSELYKASKTATIIKMVGTGLRICAALFLEPGYRKSVSERDINVSPKMRVAYAIPSSGFGYFVPRNKSAPDDSCVYTAIESKEIKTGLEDWKIPGNPVYEIEAMYLPPIDKIDSTQRVVALVFQE